MNPLSVYHLGTLLDNVALNGAASTRTFTVGPDLGDSSTGLRKGEVARYAQLVLDVSYTHANNGALSFTFLCGDTVASATRKPTTATVASGNATLNIGGVVSTPSLSANSLFTFPFGKTGLPALSVVVAHGGAPSASDKITVKGWLVP